MMKKLIIFSALGFLAAAASVAMAATSTFTLAVGESHTLADFQNAKVTLNSINALQLQTYPPQESKQAEFTVNGKNYSAGEGGSVFAMGIDITVQTISSGSVSFLASFPSGSGTPPASGGKGDVPVSPVPDDSFVMPMMNLPKGLEIISTMQVGSSTSTAAHIKVLAKKKARLFFIFPVSYEITYAVDAETGSSRVIKRPWWNFLAW